MAGKPPRPSRPMTAPPTTVELARAAEAEAKAARARERAALGVQIGPAQRGRPRNPVAPTPPDPILHNTYAIAKATLGVEQQQRERARAMRVGEEVRRDEEGRRLEVTKTSGKQARPVRVLMRTKRPDATVIVDSKGEMVNLTGKVPRWVREKDQEDRPTDARVADFQNYGYKPVLDPHTKQPIRGFLGLAMAGTPEAAAARMVDYAREGMLTPAKMLDSLADEVAAINRAAGGAVLLLHEADEHTREPEPPAAAVPQEAAEPEETTEDE